MATALPYHSYAGLQSTDMRWLSTNADEHLLVDDAGRRTEYSIRRDPVVGTFQAYDGTAKLDKPKLAIYPLLKQCEERYAAERAEGKQSPNYHGKTRLKERA